MHQSDGRLLPLLALAVGLVMTGACILWAHARATTVTAGEVFTALAAGDHSQIDLYLADGGDPNITNAEGIPLLHLVVGGAPNPMTLDLLLDHGADPNRKTPSGATALMRASQACALDEVTRLLEAGARVGPLDAEGRGAFDVVCTGEPRRQIVELLRRKLFLQAQGGWTVTD